MGGKNEIVLEEIYLGKIPALHNLDGSKDHVLTHAQLFLLPQGDAPLVLALELFGGVDGLLVWRRDGEDDAWHQALAARACHHAPLDSVAVVMHGATLALVDAHLRGTNERVLNFKVLQACGINGASSVRFSS